MVKAEEKDKLRVVTFCISIKPWVFGVTNGEGKTIEHIVGTHGTYVIPVTPAAYTSMWRAGSRGFYSYHLKAAPNLRWIDLCPGHRHKYISAAGEIIGELRMLTQEVKAKPALLLTPWPVGSSPVRKNTSMSRLYWGQQWW